MRGTAADGTGFNISLVRRVLCLNEGQWTRLATLTAHQPSIPSLHEALAAHDLAASRELYNILKDDEAQPDVAEKHIQHLAGLFTRHNAEKVFGIHLVHGHFQIPSGTVMVGQNFADPALRWAKTVPVNELDDATIHGHIFVLAKNGFLAYEFQDGPLPDLNSVGAGFLDEFAAYIKANGLVGLIGLQVLGEDPGHRRAMSELILEQGTVMLDSSVIKNCQPTRITGWTFESVGGQPRVCASNEKHAKLQTGNHKVYNVGKPRPKLESVEDLKHALVEVGVL